VAPPLLGIPPLGPAFQNRDRHGAASPPGGPTTPFSPELARLASAVASFDQVPRELEPAQGLPRVAWIAGAIVVIAIVTLIALVRS
jgi:hypothetical protein